MAIIINTDSKNGADNIDVSRQKTNKSNLVEAINLWKDVIEIDEKKYLSFRDFRSVKKDLQRIVTQTIPSRLKKNHILYGIDSPEDISWSDIKKMANEYLNANEWLQINFCKDSTRQSVDERVQIKMLNLGLQDSGFKFNKCTPKRWVYDGKLLSKNEYKNIDSNNSRKDIDTFGSNGRSNIWIFQKYAKVSGGHQDNVLIETQHFISDAEKFVMQNDTKDYFIAQLDGKFIEEKSIDLRKNISSKSKIFVGNTEEVIYWIKNKLN